MARRLDTGWRDGLLTVRHAYWGHEYPAAGTPFPMIEYDRGKPVAVISYQRRHGPLPTGEDTVRTHTAFSRLTDTDGLPLPFFTAVYDVRNWAYRVFGHNDAARSTLDSPKWVSMTETQFAKHLYGLRRRVMPDLEPYGVKLADDVWLPCDPDPGFSVAEDWPHQLMSARRRNFEPVGQTRMTWRNPCLDLDLAVVDRDGRLALVVDYKATSAKINPDSTNMKALAGLYTTYSHLGVQAVPAMLVRYTPSKPSWSLNVMPLNAAASQLIAYAMGTTGNFDDALTRAIAQPGGWNDLSEKQWRTVLDVAQNL